MQTEAYLEDADLDDIKRRDILINQFSQYNQNFGQPEYTQHGDWDEIHNQIQHHSHYVYRRETYQNNPPIIPDLTLHNRVKRGVGKYELSR